MLSEHFTEAEFADRETGEVIAIDPKLIEGLELLRAAIGRPIRITSGYRSPETNAKVDPNAPKSQHISGRAADIVVDGMNLLSLLEAVFRIPAFAAGGIGLNAKNNHIHVDTRPGGRARWIE